MTTKPDDVTDAVWGIATDAALDWFHPDDKHYRECAVHFAQIIMAERTAACDRIRALPDVRPEYAVCIEAVMGGGK